MNELDILKLVASRLNDAEIDYMLSGSVALTFYGKPRMTRTGLVRPFGYGFDLKEGPG